MNALKGMQEEVCPIIVRLDSRKWRIARLSWKPMTIITKHMNSNVTLPRLCNHAHRRQATAMESSSVSCSNAATPSSMDQKNMTRWWAGQWFSVSLSLPPSFSFSISISILSILSICLSIYICIYIYIYISVPKEKKSSRWKWPFLNMWRRYQELNAYLSRVTGVSISQDDFACSATDGNGNFFREAAWEYARSSSSAQILNWVFSCNSNFNFTTTVTWTHHTNTRLPPPQIDFVQQPHNGHWLCTNRRNRVHSGKSLVYLFIW